MTIGTELILLFFISLGLSLVLTPVARTVGINLGAMDIPAERKVHTKPIPRIGGLAVFFAFMFACCTGNRFFPNAGYLYNFSFNALMGHAGAILILLCGLFDDFRRLNPWIKLFFQVVAATFAFIGGATITNFFIGGYGISFNPFFSYIVTVLWFLLFINAVNLVDGLDGLAAGLVFFTCVVMAFSTYFHGQYLYTFYFVILGGAVLGFLKYNFNPASIFLGDGGSYFLGYLIAILAIRSSSKSNVSVLMLIPLLALGLPIFDSILSPLRRFIRGRSMFQPDKGHIHHALLRMGLNSRKAVMIIYGISMTLCVMGILLMLFRGRGMEGFVLALLLGGAIFLVRKLGYIEYLAIDKFYGWFQDITDVTGLSRARRSFLSLQIEVSKSQNMEEIWSRIGDALEMLSFDRAELHYKTEQVREWRKQNLTNDKSVSVDDERENNNSLMRIEIPLMEYPGAEFFGKLILIKDLNKSALKSYTIRRVEHLRRTIIANIVRLKNKEK